MNLTALKEQLEKVEDLEGKLIVEGNSFEYKGQKILVNNSIPTIKTKRYSPFFARFSKVFEEVMGYSPTFSYMDEQDNQTNEWCNQGKRRRYTVLAKKEKVRGLTVLDIDLRKELRKCQNQI